MGSEDKEPLWKIIVWAIATPGVAIVITVFIAVGMGGFEWPLVGQAFRMLWMPLVSVFGVVAILMFLIGRYRKRAIVIGLLVICFVFLLASFKGNEISERMRWLICDNFEISLLTGSITVMALALAIATIVGKGKEKEKE